MNLRELYKKQRHYQEMITKHLAVGNDVWVNRYNAELAEVNKKIRIIRRKEKQT